MRRRPEEDDQEEPERGQRQVAGRGGEADERRHRPGGAADDDVLHRRALQIARVDDDVEEVPDEREHRCQHVDGACEQRERERREDEAELERPRGRHAARGDRSLLGARSHQPVDVGVEDVVERARRRRRRARARAIAAANVPSRRQPSRADEHAGGAGDEQQRHDPRLRQRHVVAPRAERQRLAAERQRGADERCRRAQRPRTRRGATSPSAAPSVAATRPPEPIATSISEAAAVDGTRSRGYVHQAATATPASSGSATSAMPL